jgi:NAD(P)H-hydrate epimerase
MKVLTAAQMREVDRRTIESGIPGIVLMENAACRVVEFLAERFEPLSSHRIAILCGKGNNGGDGLAIARQICTRFEPEALYVVLLAEPEDLKGDAAANYRMLQACGCEAFREIPADARNATLVIDALLGTGISGPATGRMLDAIRAINNDFPLANVVAVDIPSGMPSDSGEPTGEYSQVDATVTFTAPKVAQATPPNCDAVGELVVAPIGTPPAMYEDDDSIWLSLIEPAMFAGLLAPRPPSGHKGTFGHVLVVAGSRGKSGAAAMTGIGALRAGAGLVTVASAASAVPVIAAHAPELMTAPLEENDAGTISAGVELSALTEGKTVLAMGPGLGRHPDVEELVSRVARDFEGPMVLDADALWGRIEPSSRVRVLTPHPGEMSRLTGKPTAEIQRDRAGTARAFATERGVILVLKGQRTVIAFPDGRVWINPTGTPALGTGGSGDVLTGLIAGFLAQFPHAPDRAVAAAVYLHGLAGELGALEVGEKCLIATDILKYLPNAMEECAALPDAD